MSANLQKAIDLYNKGLDLLDDEQFEQAAACHLEALRLMPGWQFPEAWHNAGAGLIRINRRDEAQPYLQRALTEYEAAIVRQPEKEDEYLYWTAGVYALLRNKQQMLNFLEQCFEINDAWAKNALYEEDFYEYRQDEDFTALVEPIVKAIDLLTFRGKGMSREEYSPLQHEWRNVFIQSLEQAGWKKDSTFTDGFENMSISPQAMYEYCSNRFFCLRLNLHADTNLVFFELWSRTDPNNILYFRLYFDENQMLEQISPVIEYLNTHRDEFDGENWAQLIKGLIPLCRELFFQGLDGMRVRLG